MIDRQYFYREIRRSLFTSGLTQAQVDGINVILDEWDRVGSDAPLDYLAYMLATAYHETSRHMTAVIETRQANESVNPSVDEAIRRLENSFRAGRLTWVKRPYWRKDESGKSWLGRGLVQITFKANYERLSETISVDLVADPDLALRQDIAVKIMFAGMHQALFTGKALRDYIDGVDETDAEDLREFTNARRIINGTESAAKVAAIAMNFKSALRRV